ncbi:hypothetical protein PG994_013081 [Apiospora phragmitis]|uniref:Major facilitator superfamily (MFS) profile domain-containing protein n=1 Tax=Apiospora phragmitis TaxID=2905665 RepID=A0ABR1T7M0_9PEZI
MAPCSSASTIEKSEHRPTALLNRGLTEDEIGSLPANHEGTPSELSVLRFCLLALGVCLGLFLSFIDSSIVATSLFSIGSDFNDLERVNWVAISYTLAYMGCAVLFARISDIIGRRDAFVAAYIIFFAFSIGCGFAQDMNQLIACRALQGIGGSGLYSLTMVILTETSPDRFRSSLASIIGVVIAIGGVLGPVLGGILTHYASWRWVFWINGPIGAVSMALFYCSWPKAEFLPDLERRKWSELDYPGSVLLIAAATLVVFPFQNAGSADNVWGEAIFLAPLLVGVACWVALILWTMFADRRWSDKLSAAFPMRLMRQRVYTATVLNTAFVGFEFIMLIYAFPLRLQVVNGKSALMAGVMLLPLLGGSALGSVVAGVVNKKNDWFCETLVVSNCLMVLGCGLLSTQSASADVEAKALGFLVFVGFGFGLTVASATMLATVQATVQDSAPAQGILSQIRILGGSMGIAASAAILGRHLDGIVDPGQLPAIEHHPEDFPIEQLQAIRTAYSETFKLDMRVCAMVGGIGILFACAVWTPNRRPLDELRNQRLEEEAQRRRATNTRT